MQKSASIQPSTSPSKFGGKCSILFNRVFSKDAQVAPLRATPCRSVSSPQRQSTSSTTRGSAKSSKSSRSSKYIVSTSSGERFAREREKLNEQLPLEVGGFWRRDLTFCAVTLNIGGRNTNPVEFVLDGDESGIGAACTALGSQLLEAMGSDLS